MAEHLASIFGTEKDRVNCPFYFKIGACRHGDRCSRLHNRPTLSPTLLLKNLYQNPLINPPLGPDGRPVPFDKRRVQEFFEDFYEDIFLELAKSGTVEEFVVCDNVADHMAGNCYVRFADEQAAKRALESLAGRYYAGRPIAVEFSPVTDFREATCRQYEEGTCARGGYCNFMHVRPVGRELSRALFGDDRAERKAHGGAPGDRAGGYGDRYGGRGGGRDFGDRYGGGRGGGRDFGDRYGGGRGGGRDFGDRYGGNDRWGGGGDRYGGNDRWGGGGDRYGGNGGRYGARDLRSGYGGGRDARPPYGRDDRDDREPKDLYSRGRYGDDLRGGGRYGDDARGGRGRGYGDDTRGARGGRYDDDPRGGPGRSYGDEGGYGRGRDRDRGGPGGSPERDSSAERRARIAAWNDEGPGGDVEGPPPPPPPPEQRY